MAEGRSSIAATYVFCLVQSRRPPSLRSVPDSVPGAGSPRLLQIDRDIWAVVADAPLERFSGEALQKELQDVDAISRHALAHASIVEFFFHHAPVIPLKLLTLFSSDEVARAGLKARAARLRRMFADLRGLEEWGVRIFAGEVEERGAAALTSGREYLQTKKRLHDQAVAPPRTIVRTVNGALSSIGKLAARTKKEAFPSPGKGRPYVAGASYLVRTARRGAWRKKVMKTTSHLASQGHRLEMSGPWPPYHFVSR
jgi:hypothetical protein